jgi:hypothetical protein
MSLPLLRTKLDSGILFWLLSAFCVGIVYASWFPGVFTLDEQDMVSQTISGVFHDWHSPLLVRLWQVTGTIKIGPAIPYFIACAVAIFCAAALLRLILPFKPAASIALLCFIFSPPVFVSLGLVTKDLFFADSMMLAVLLMSRFARSPTVLQAIFYFPILYIPVFIRLDAIFALIPVFLWFFTSLGKSISLPILKNPGAAKVLLSTLVIFAILSGPLLVSTVNRFPLHARPVHSEQIFMLFDLTAISVQTNTMLVPKSRLRTETNPLSVLRARLSPSAADTLVWGPDANNLIYSPDADHSELHQAWLNALRKYPLQYLRTRGEYAARFFGIRNDVDWLRGQFSGDESMVQRLPEQGWLRAQSHLQAFYASLSLGPGWSHYAYLPWVWMLVGVASWLTWSLRSYLRSPTLSFQIVTTLGTSAILHNFFMCIVSAEAVARYHTWSRIVFGMLFAIAVASFLPSSKPRGTKTLQDSLFRQPVDIRG